MKATELGDLLRWCRQQNGWKQQVLADRLMVDRSVISRHENGVVLDLNLVKKWGISTGYQDLVNQGVLDYLEITDSRSSKYLMFEQLLNASEQYLHQIHTLQASLKAIS